MKRITRQQAADAIKRREPFRTHGSLWAQVQDGQYTVISYATPIATCSPNGVWVLDQRKYSATTSRHQGVVRRAVA